MLAVVVEVVIMCVDLDVCLDVDFDGDIDDGDLWVVEMVRLMLIILT